MILQRFRTAAYEKLLLPTAGNFLLQRLEKATKSILRTQESVLRSILYDTSKTQFGKKYNLSFRTTIADYRNSVPILAYTQHCKYIKRMCKGETDLLLPGKPLFYLESNTSAIPRLFPVSERYFNAAVLRFNMLWQFVVLRDNPGIFSGPWLWVHEPAVEGQVEDGTPFGSVSGSIFNALPAVLRQKHAVPDPIFNITNSEARFYAMMRYTLQTGLNWIAAEDPHLLARFHRTILSNREQLLRDIHDGTLRTDIAAEIDPEARFPLLKQLTPDPGRARILSSIFESHSDRILPRHYWPDLACISTRTTGNSIELVKELAGLFPKHTVFRDSGYQSSEVRGGMVLENNWHHSLPMINEFFFEFIETDKRIQPVPPVLLVSELEIGKEYYLIVTNGSGLFRYDTNEIIRITGFYNACPLFEYIQKGESVTSIHGEQLTEKQVILAINQASAETNLHFSYFTLFCDHDAKRYLLYIEFADSSEKELSREHFATSFDAHLKYYNRTYATARNIGEILTPVLVELYKNAWEQLKSFFLDDGVQPEDTFILKHLQDDMETMHFFNEFRRVCYTKEND